MEVARRIRSEVAPQHGIHSHNYLFARFQVCDLDNADQVLCRRGAEGDSSRRLEEFANEGGFAADAWGSCKRTVVAYASVSTSRAVASAKRDKSVINKDIHDVYVAGARPPRGIR